MANTFATRTPLTVEQISAREATLTSLLVADSLARETDRASRLHDAAVLLIEYRERHGADAATLKKEVREIRNRAWTATVAKCKELAPAFVEPSNRLDLVSPVRWDGLTQVYSVALGAVLAATPEQIAGMYDGKIGADVVYQAALAEARKVKADEAAAAEAKVKAAAEEEEAAAAAAAEADGTPHGKAVYLLSQAVKPLQLVVSADGVSDAAVAEALAWLSPGVVARLAQIHAADTKGYKRLLATIKEEAPEATATAS